MSTINNIEYLNKLKKDGLFRFADPLFEDAAYYVFSVGVCSHLMIQKQFSIGYSRAMKLVKMLSKAKIICKDNGRFPYVACADKAALEDILRVLTLN